MVFLSRGGARGLEVLTRAVGCDAVTRGGWVGLEREGRCSARWREMANVWMGSRRGDGDGRWRRRWRGMTVDRWRLVGGKAREDKSESGSEWPLRARQSVDLIQRPLIFHWRSEMDS